MTNLIDISIKPVNLSDLEVLQEVAKSTFLEAFGAANASANMQKYLNEKFDKERIASEVENPLSQFFFAEVNGRIAGYLKVNAGTAQTESMAGKTLEIERIYVLSDYYGKGVGKLLFDKALAIAKHEQMDAIWLGVWEENPRAIRFYEKNGFKEFDKHIFMLGEDKQTDIMMKLELEKVSKTE